MDVLVSAYACEPGKGSEPGAGWNWLQAIALDHRVCVITRSNNRPAIERGASEAGLGAVEFRYVDLPHWARWWKRGGRGIRLYYGLWQVLAGREARRLHRQRRFDVVHHLTFANGWMPALACTVDAPFVLGPVAGGQRVPWRMLHVVGPVGCGVELLSRCVRLLNTANPVVRRAWSRAGVILVTNDETKSALPKPYRHKVRVRPNACVPRDFPRATQPRIGLVAVSAGRLNRFKAVSLAIRAIALVPQWSLIVVGDGSEKPRLQRLARRLGVESRVSFVTWLPQLELWNLLASARALVHPSLKEGSPFIAVEAQALGVPVVALDQGGARALARTPGSWFELVPAVSSRQAVLGIATALERIEHDCESSVTARFDVDTIASDLDAVYRDVAGTRGLGDSGPTSRSEIGMTAT